MLELALAMVLRLHAQTFDIYPPKAKGPTLIFVHGGAWVSGSKARYRRLGEAFAGAGVCAVIVGYRLAPATRHPGPIEDLEQARRAFTRHPPTRCDARRVVFMGHSAGAHAIAHWATRHLERGVKGFIGLEGIYDIPKLAARWPGYGTTFLKDEFGADRGRWAAASPARASFATRSPWLVVHSKDDELVDAGQAEDFVSHLGAEKIAAELYAPEHFTHFDVVRELETSTSRAFLRIKEFIERVVKR